MNDIKATAEEKSMELDKHINKPWFHQEWSELANKSKQLPKSQ